MNDLINRQAAIELAMQYCPDDDGSCSRADCDIRELLDDIEALPPIQPEQKIGKWIEVNDYRISGICSVCGWESHLYEDDVVGMDFCPNCGARLKRE